ncbi:MAG: PH domain-containing protein [bacterium]|nr:PH domain-containing protein [bacterium]
MDGMITERNYPIRNIWLFKPMFFVLTIAPALLIFLTIFYSMLADIPEILPILSSLFFFTVLISFLFFSIRVIINLCQRSNFHYSINENFIVLHQGVISKQNRNVPYGRIQGVFVRQGLFERIFGLASMTFEDFSQGGRSRMSADGLITNGKSGYEAIGFEGNRVHIPGLKKEDAYALHSLILQKVKEYPIEDNQSGL